MHLHFYSFRTEILRLGAKQFDSNTNFRMTVKFYEISLEDS